MSLGEIVSWVIVGGLGGVLADLVVKGIRLPLLGAIAVGMAGGLVGGWLFNTLGFWPAGGLIGDLIAAFVGAVVLLLILKLLRRK
jgi:uncharacterized membrane protein YeaQ/YmgE (transglycosylase-associated protein family)